MRITGNGVLIPAVVALAMGAMATRASAQDTRGSSHRDEGTQQGKQGDNAPEKPAAKVPPTEGTLEVKVAGAKPEKIDYEMKGDKIKLSISSSPNNPKNGLDAIIDVSDRKATLLMNDHKTYAEVDLARLAKMGSQAVAPAEKMKLTSTGKADTVANTTCEILQLQNAKYDVTTCAVKGGPRINLSALEKSGGFTAPPWLSQLVDEGYIPLRVNVKHKGGEPIVTTQVTDWSHQPVPDTDFAIPQGYKKTTLPGLPAPEGGSAKGKSNNPPPKK